MRTASCALVGLLLVVGCDPSECTLQDDCPSTQVCVAGSCRAETIPPRAPHIGLTDGWNDPVGTGLVFVVSRFSFLPAERGFDVDGRCRGDADCLDALLGELGRLYNDQFRQLLLGGELVTLLEISGLDAPFYGVDERVTLKSYIAEDADDPFFPANNFTTLQGGTSCCEFLVSKGSVEGHPAVARHRSRAAIHDHALRVGAETEIAFAFFPGEAGAADSTLLLERAQTWLEIGANGSSLSGQIGGVVTIANARRAPLPGCSEPRKKEDLPSADACESGFLLLALLAGQPDIDMDDDGLETIELGRDGGVVKCFDGCGERCPVAPLVEDDPASCVFAPQMRDGFSIAIDIAGVPATIVGTSTRTAEPGRELIRRVRPGLQPFWEER